MHKHGFQFKLMLVVLVGIIILSGCASSSVMTRADVMGSPDCNHALVTFLRPSGYGARQFGVWDGENFVGALSPGSFTQYLAKPGRHIFLAQARNFGYIKANLKSGKKYYILFKKLSGGRTTGYAFAPITKIVAISQSKIDKWMTSLSPTKVISSKRDAYVKSNLSKIKRAIENFNSQSVTFKTLEANDYRPVDIYSFAVSLHSPKIPKTTSPKGVMASIKFRSENSLESEKLVLVLTFQVNQDGVSRTQHYLYKGKISQMPTKYSPPLFSMSSKQSGQISFPLYTPEIKGPPRRRVGYQSYTQGRLFWLKGLKNVSIYLAKCQDEKCRKRSRISNSIEALVEF